MARGEEIRYHDLGMDERKKILDLLADTITGVGRIRLAYAFGSFVRGDRFRDLDVAVLLEDADDWRLTGRLESRLQERVEDFSVPIDVVPLNDAPPHFRKKVAEEGVLLFEARRGESLDFWVRATSEWMDLNAWLAAMKGKVA